MGDIHLFTCSPLNNVHSSHDVTVMFQKVMSTSRKLMVAGSLLILVPGVLNL